jgi:hypothetical protein
MGEPMVLVSLTHIVNLESLDEPQYNAVGVGRIDPVYFGNFSAAEPHFPSYTPPPVPESRFVSAYGFLSDNDGPRYKSIFIPTHFDPNNPDFSSAIPVPAGDGVFEIVSKTGRAPFQLDVPFDLTTFDPLGVSSFAIHGFDASEKIRADAMLPFNYGVVFMSGGDVTSLVIPFVPVSVPEPDSGFFAAGVVCAGLFLRSSRRRWRWSDLQLR